MITKPAGLQQKRCPLATYMHQVLKMCGSTKMKFTKKKNEMHQMRAQHETLQNRNYIRKCKMVIEWEQIHVI